MTTCFVNVGSDHPSVIEAIIKGKRERAGRWPKMITCPSEMIAISMADGHARVTGRPQAVIVHVDVGTQALAHGIHNASIGRAPVFIFAGLCPFTESREMPGSRTEYMHWLQEPPDQKAIVRQYCRYTGEIRSGLNVKQLVGRALQFASSDPKGPVYLCAAREVLAETIQPYSLNTSQWTPVGPSALPTDAVKTIANALVQAARPLVITGYSGRDRRCPIELVKLADQIPGLRVHDTGGSDACFPFDHPASLGFRLGYDECIRDADVVLLANCDVPWIPSRNSPRTDAKIYQVDIDPLNQHIPVSFFPANGRWRADCYTALTQINSHVESSALATQVIQDPKARSRRNHLKQTHSERMLAIAKLADLDSEVPLHGHKVGALLKRHLPADTTFVVEAVTNSHIISDQLQPSIPGSWINCGGTGIGWSNGAALGVRMAIDEETVPSNGTSGGSSSPKSLVCQVVGDGSYMCASPASAAWVAAKYRIPILIVVLNNGGMCANRTLLPNIEHEMRSPLTSIARLESSPRVY